MNTFRVFCIATAQNVQHAKQISTENVLHIFLQLRLEANFLILYTVGIAALVLCGVTAKKHIDVGQTMLARFPIFL